MCSCTSSVGKSESGAALFLVHTFSGFEISTMIQLCRLFLNLLLQMKSYFSSCPGNFKRENYGGKGEKKDCSWAPVLDTTNAGAL